MKICFLGAALALVAVACSGTTLTEDLSAEGPDTAEDTAALTSGKVSLRLPIVERSGRPLSRHNAALKAAGLGTFPDFVEIEGGANGAHLPGADKPFTEASILVDKANEKLNLDLEMV